MCAKSIFFGEMVLTTYQVCESSNSGSALLGKIIVSGTADREHQKSGIRRAGGNHKYYLFLLIYAAQKVLYWDTGSVRC